MFVGRQGCCPWLQFGSTSSPASRRLFGGRFAFVDSSVNEFLEFLSVEKGASGNTIAAYRNDLSQLEEFILSPKKNGNGVAWQSVVSARYWTTSSSLRASPI